MSCLYCIGYFAFTCYTSPGHMLKFLFRLSLAKSFCNPTFCVLTSRYGWHTKATLEDRTVLYSVHVLNQKSIDEYSYKMLNVIMCKGKRKVLKVWKGVAYSINAIIAIVAVNLFLQKNEMQNTPLHSLSWLHYGIIIAAKLSMSIVFRCSTFTIFFCSTFPRSNYL